MTALHLVTDEPLTPLDTLRAALERQDEVVLSGCAGTGKTWHVQHLLTEGVVLCAPTAKAAERMKEVCRHPAMTVHSLVYGAPKVVWIKSETELPCKGVEIEGPCPACDGRLASCTTCKGSGVAKVHIDPPSCPGCTCRQELRFGRAKGLEGEVDLIVVDEASMVGAKLASDIRETARKLREERNDTWETVEQEPVKILWVGDPAQLPPVGDDPGVNLYNPDVRLERVYRAQGDILALATEIRQATNFGELAAAIAAPRFEVNPDGTPTVQVRTDGLGGMASWRAGRSRRMAIVHSNRQRIEANEWVRKVLKRAGPLVTGDRIIIRKNCRPVPVWNGEVYVVVAVERVGGFTIIKGRIDGIDAAPTIQFVVDERHLAATSPDDFARDERAMSMRFQALSSIEHHRECTFFSGLGDDCHAECKPGPLAGLHLVNAQHGFVITCHASQGSEADEVGVLWTPYTHGDRFADARAWLYTAVTRARKSLTIWSGGR